MKKMKTILLDDEKDAIRLLSMELQKISDEIEIVASFTNARDAVDFMMKNPPDLLFLDVEMPQMNGFDVLDQLGDFRFSVVFVTAYDRYAIKAFRYHALDYITKPFETEALRDAIQRAKSNQVTTEQFAGLGKATKSRLLDKIAIPTNKGIIFVEVLDICCIEADNNYSNIHLKSGNKITCSRLLKEMEQIIDDEGFFRVHRQFIVNLREVVHLNKTDSLLTLSNRMVISISREQKEHILEYFRR